MSFSIVNELYEELGNALRGLVNNAGVPFPCPKCGRPVEARLCGPKLWEVACADNATTSLDSALFPRGSVDVLCNYRCAPQQNWQDAWREHDRMCRKTWGGEGSAKLTFIYRDTEEDEG